jgi:hypothetical protein
VKAPQTLEEKHKIAEEIVGVPIRWEPDGRRGFMICPMADAHTKPTKDTHTICYLDGVPTFFCWHQSCKEWIEVANTELREKLDDKSSEDKARDAQVRAARVQSQVVSDSFRRNLSEIITKYKCDDIFEGPKPQPRDSFLRFLSLWESNDYIWIGDVWDTGVSDKKDNRSHFATVVEWKSRQVNLNANHYATASSFNPGSVDRITTNIAKTPYTIVEFDSLSPNPETNKRRGAAILKYLASHGLNLVMVVDSGNKSVHGWFRNDLKEEDMFFLRQIGADPQSMRPSQPVRLPGGIRSNGKIQHLLWIA